MRSDQDGLIEAYSTRITRGERRREAIYRVENSLTSAARPVISLGRTHQLHAMPTTPEQATGLKLSGKPESAFPTVRPTIDRALDRAELYRLGEHKTLF